MSDFKIPDLPSDDDLGITKEDLEKYGGDDDKPELSEAEMAALLGEAPRPAPSAPPRAKAAPGGKEAKAPPPKSPPPPKKAAPAPGEPEGPRSRWRGPAVAVALLALTWLSSGYRTLPSPEPANAPDTVFSSARAMAHLVEIARRPHPPGSPAHAQVRDYLVERLRALGLEPRIQTSTVLQGGGERVRAATIRNVIARIPGRASTGTVVLTAHYDSRGISHGAGDDGVGTVAILEIARALLAGADPQNDVLLVLTDAEELGLMGARAFVDEDPAMDDVRAVISVEMRGGGGPSVMFETGPENGWILQALKASGARPWANSMSYEIYQRLPNDTDFTPFREAGRQGLNFAGIGRASIYHQSYDTPANVSEATLQHHGDSGLRAARYLADTPLTSVDAPDVTFLVLPVVGLVTWDVGLALPIAAGVLVLALVILLPVRRGGRGWGGIVTGLVLGALTVAGTAGAGYALSGWLPRFHPEYGSLHGSAFHQEGWYVLALVAVALALATGLFGVARRRVPAAELTWGALVPLLLAMVFVSVRFPAAAANLQIPLAAALLGTGLLAAPTRGAVGHLVTVLLLLSAAAVLAVQVPVTEFVWLGLSFRAAAVVGAIAATGALLLLPALDRLREPNAWWAPASALLAAGLFLTVGIRLASPDPRYPAPSTLAYLYDHGTGEALWLTDTSEEAVDAPALAWAEAAAGAAFGETRSLDRYGLGTRELRVAPAAAPSPGARGPELWTLSDTTAGGVRRVTLALRSAVAAEAIQLRFPESGATRLVALNGRPMPGEGRPTFVEHWGTPDPVLVLELETTEGTALELDIVEHLLRPAELVGAAPFERPAELAPDITWLSDRAVLRTPAAGLEIVPGPPPFPLEPAQDSPATGGAPAQGVPDAAAADSLATPPDTVTAPPTDTIPPVAG